MSKTIIPKQAHSAPQYTCTDCSKDAYIGYTEGWDGQVKKGERLCTSCFTKRGGENFFGPTRKVKP